MLAGVPAAPGAEEFVPVQLSSPTAEQSTYSATARVLVAGQVVLAVGVALAGLVAVGQAFGRHHAARAGDQRVESALGMTTTERVLARLLAAGAGRPGRRRRRPPPGGSWRARSSRSARCAASSRTRVGRPTWPLVVVGGLAVGLAVTVLVALSAWRAGRARPAVRRPAAAVTALVGRAPGPVGTAGMGLALVPGGDPAPVPLRSSATGAVLGIAGVVAVAVFGAGMARLVDTPERWGWSADVSVVDATPEIAESLLADPAVAAVSMLDAATVRIDGTLVNGYASTPVAGDVLTWTVVDGRLPDRRRRDRPRHAARRPARSAHRRHRSRSATTAPATVTVVGIGLGPSSSGEALGTTALVTPARLDGLRGDGGVPGGAGPRRARRRRRRARVVVAALRADRAGATARGGQPRLAGSAPARPSPPCSASSRWPGWCTR